MATVAVTARGRRDCTLRGMPLNAAACPHFRRTTAFRMCPLTGPSKFLSHGCDHPGALAACGCAAVRARRGPWGIRAHGGGGGGRLGPPSRGGQGQRSADTGAPRRICDSYRTDATITGRLRPAAARRCAPVGALGTSEPTAAAGAAALTRRVGPPKGSAAPTRAKPRRICDSYSTDPTTPGRLRPAAARRCAPVGALGASEPMAAAGAAASARRAGEAEGSAAPTRARPRRICDSYRTDATLPGRLRPAAARRCAPLGALGTSEPTAVHGLMDGWCGAIGSRI